MDIINLRILCALSNNARISFAELGRQLHLSAPAIAARIKGLERTGIITGYKPQVDLRGIGAPVRALIKCQVYNTKQRSFRTYLKSMNEIVKIYKVTGNDSFIIEVGVTDKIKLDEVLNKMKGYCDKVTKSIIMIDYDEVLPKREPVTNFMLRHEVAPVIV